MKHILSFDIAKGKSVYCFIDELRNTIIDASFIEHNKIEFDNLYNLIKDYRDGFEEEIVKEKMTDYFNDFDYVVGDWAYSKVRLKGFYDKTNKKVKNLNNYENVEKYLVENCAPNARYFILKKIS